MLRVARSVRRTLVVTTALTSVAAVLVGASPAQARPVAAAAPAPTRATAGHHGFGAGSSGIGDPYFPREGNGGYDVAHYNLRLSYDPASHRLAGSNTITARATQNLSRFDLDLTGFRVSSVRVDGHRARFHRTGQELVITPARGLRRGHSFVTRVAYAGVPKTITGSPIVFGAPYGWIYTKDGAFVGCEPNAAHTWYPSNDHPRDKATFRFRITVPKDRQVAANGDFVSQRRHGSHATFVWAERTPMPTYLATIDVGRWQFHRDRTPGGIEQITAVDPALARGARRQHIIAKTAAITDFWARTFGPYPFGSTGAIVDNVPSIGFSLETVTRPLYGFVPDQFTASHELSHEWFGDSVSVRDWNDIWLNEGFATFASWLWAEHIHQGSTLATARSYFRQIPASDGFWHQSVSEPGRNGMFSGAVYVRGGMTLAALREKVGDRDFFDLLRTWARVHRHGNADTGQFVALAERITHRDLGHFFRVWLVDQTKPGHL